MPVSYPAPAPSVTTDGVLTISRFLNSPALILRRLRALAENRFIGDVLLSGRVTTSGGAVQFEQNEPIFTDRIPEAVEPGGDYPLTTLGNGPSLISSVRKWGVDTLVTDEAIKRLLMNPVDRALTKLVNGVVKQVDTVALAAINAAVTQTMAVATAWSTSTRILRDLLTAKATILALNQGYSPDLAVVDDLTYAILMSDSTISAGLRREDPTNPIYTGQFPVIGGLKILPTPNLPTAGRAYVLDSTMLGAMADEEPLSSKSIRDDKYEQWRLRAKRIVVPIVQEPASALMLSGI